MMLLTHYYPQDSQPFQTLSSLTDQEALTVMYSLRDRPGSVYRRFQNPTHYWQQRQTVEQWLRQEFIKKGGRPNTLYPHYFVVNRSLWIEEGYNGQSRSIQIPLATFAAHHVSFTYPDSMISYWLQSQYNQAFHQPAYHGQVLSYDELLPIIQNFGIPRDEWRNCPERKYDLFIEAQVWTNLPE
jgi:hypothetical protein